METTMLAITVLLLVTMTTCCYSKELVLNFSFCSSGSVIQLSDDAPCANCVMCSYSSDNSMTFCPGTVDTSLCSFKSVGKWQPFLGKWKGFNISNKNGKNVDPDARETTQTPGKQYSPGPHASIFGDKTFVSVVICVVILFVVMILVVLSYIGYRVKKHKMKLRGLRYNSFAAYNPRYVEEDADDPRYTADPTSRTSARELLRPAARSTWHGYPQTEEPTHIRWPPLGGIHIQDDANDSNPNTVATSNPTSESGSGHYVYIQSFVNTHLGETDSVPIAEELPV